MWEMRVAVALLYGGCSTKLIRIILIEHFRERDACHITGVHRSRDV